MEQVYKGPDSAPPDEQGLVDTFSFDGVTAQVLRSGSREIYVALNPPDAIPYLHAHYKTSNAEVLGFISEHLKDLRDMRTDMLRRFKKSSSNKCRYRTGEVAYLLGRPFMIRVLSLASGGKMRHAARGRMQTSVRANYELSLVELNVVQANNFDQRKDTFLSWAAPIVQRNALKIVNLGLERAQVSELVVNEVRVVQLGRRFAQYDRAHERLFISEQLVGFPPTVVLYACMREIANELYPQSESKREIKVEQERQTFLEKACPEWEQARAILDEPESVYRLQI